VSEYTEDRSGESWDLGVVILSWEDTVRYASTGRSGYNVALHEFAHQLDMENGEMDGTPGLADRVARERWTRVFTAAYDRFERAESSGRRTLIDSYAEGDPSEFFAVVTESFFERSRALRREQPDLYEVLSDYYRVDPAGWDEAARAEASAFARTRVRPRRRTQPRRRH
jgi:MtfA peptidase